VPFCSVSTTPCPDVFTGFGFVFFGNVDITNVTVDPASMFSPVAGGLTFAATDIFVNLAGKAPSVGEALILDVTTGTVPSVPEPSTWAMMALGFGFLGLLGYRKTRSALA
jgi:PEP-CTERM motif